MLFYLCPHSGGISVCLEPSRGSSLALHDPVTEASPCRYLWAAFSTVLFLQRGRCLRGLSEACRLRIYASQAAEEVARKHLTELKNLRCLLPESTGRTPLNLAAWLSLQLPFSSPRSVTPNTDEGRCESKATLPASLMLIPVNDVEHPSSPGSLP